VDDRLAAPEDDPQTDVEGHRLAANDDETVVDDDIATDAEDDVEGHRLAANDNETVIDD
jgi:hypothetical protein